MINLKDVEKEFYNINGFNAVFYNRKNSEGGI